MHDLVGEIVEGSIFKEPWTSPPVCFGRDFCLCLGDYH